MDSLFSYCISTFPFYLRMMRLIVISNLCLIVFLTCGSKLAFTDHSFALGLSRGILDNNEIDEASGIVASIANPGGLWTHNDSGDEARIFLIDTAAHYLGEVHLPGAQNRDWEDITVGPGPQDQGYVFIGDIGDNRAAHEIKRIYRVKEPQLAGHRVTVPLSITSIDSIRFTYPDGPRDAEVLFVDPWTKNLYIVTKREPESAHVYELTFPQSTTEVTIAKLLMKIPYTGFVAADMSGDGQELLMKTYTNVFHWSRLEGESISTMLARKPVLLPYASEPQGEAITFDRSGSGYFTLSEASKQKKPHLMFYKRILKDLK